MAKGDIIQIMEELERRVQELENWKRQREQQQIVNPLDSTSIAILGQHFMHIVSTITRLQGANEEIDFVGKQDAIEFLVGRNTYVPYSVNVLSNRIIPSREFYLENDRIVIFYTQDTFPNPLDGIGPFYVVNGTPRDFQVSSSQGGSPIDITTQGVGNQWFFSYGF